MACFHPNFATFLVEGQDTDVPKRTLLKFYGHHPPLQSEQARFAPGVELCELPCGQCMACRVEHARQWAIRIQLESRLYEKNAFVTLTYNDVFNEFNAVLNGQFVQYTLRPVHLQKWLKRFREQVRDRYGWTGIRFFACGEYGEQSARPHFHVILFNLPPDFELHFFKSSGSGEPLYRSPDIEKTWQYGFSSVGEVTYESAAYVARYCTKKITGAKAPEHYGKRVPEFTRMSRMPGIAADYIDSDGLLLRQFAHDTVIIQRAKGAVQCSSPKYWSRKLQERYPQVAFSLSEEKKKRAKARLNTRLQQSGKTLEKYYGDRNAVFLANFNNKNIRNL